MRVQILPRWCLKGREPVLHSPSSIIGTMTIRHTQVTSSQDLRNHDHRTNLNPVQRWTGPLNPCTIWRGFQLGPWCTGEGTAGPRVHELKSERRVPSTSRTWARRTSPPCFHVLYKRRRHRHRPIIDDPSKPVTTKLTAVTFGIGFCSVFYFETE